MDQDRSGARGLEPRVVTGLALALVLGLSAGCATQANRANRTAPDEVRETAEFYWPYAALAAHVYQTGGQADDRIALAAGSQWLGREIGAQDPARREELLRRLDKETPIGIYASRLSAPVCQEGAPAQDCAERTDDPDPDDDDAEAARPRGPSAEEPQDAQDCEYRGGREPPVPIGRVRGAPYHWEPVPELQRKLHPRGWSIFVPGLAIDVWRRPRPAEPGAEVVVEYALVYRGTADGGGWLSNFRALTAFTPLVWDQYRQARLATVDLVRQIRSLHTLSDGLFERRTRTKLLVTAVGHSLGGGLANYVFLRVPELSRVVAFDPSPVDGSSVFSPTEPSEAARRRGHRDRASVLGDRRRALDSHWRAGEASIFVLYEEGEILTSLTGCNSGPLWGSEGGPVVRCESLNLSGGSALRQHNMPQLACKLFLATQGLPTRP